MCRCGRWQCIIHSCFTCGALGPCSQIFNKHQGMLHYATKAGVSVPVTQLLTIVSHHTHISIIFSYVLCVVQFCSGVAVKMGIFPSEVLHNWWITCVQPIHQNAQHLVHTWTSESLYIMLLHYGRICRYGPTFREKGINSLSFGLFLNDTIFSSND